MHTLIIPLVFIFVVYPFSVKADGDEISEIIMLKEQMKSFEKKLDGYKSELDQHGKDFTKEFLVLRNETSNTEAVLRVEEQVDQKINIVLGATTAFLAFLTIAFSILSIFIKLGVSKDVKEMQDSIKNMEDSIKNMQDKIDKDYRSLIKLKGNIDSIFADTQIQWNYNINRLEKAQKQIKDLTKNLNISLIEVYTSLAWHYGQQAFEFYQRWDEKVRYQELALEMGKQSVVTMKKANKGKIPHLPSIEFDNKFRTGLYGVVSRNPRKFRRKNPLS